MAYTGFSSSHFFSLDRVGDVPAFEGGSPHRWTPLRLQRCQHHLYSRERHPQYEADLFTTANQQFADNNMFNDAVADDIYGKLMPVGSLTTSRISQQTFSFFIPLRYLSTIFNSGRYFFPSLLRGNGEMTLSIRSVAASLSEVFGGSRSSMAIYMNPNLNDYLWSTAASDKRLTGMFVCIIWS